MAKRLQVDIDSIKAPRAITPDDNLDDLVADIQKYGMKFPLLVDQDMNLIDGLRRLHVCYKIRAGRLDYVVPVVVSSTFEDTCVWLTKVTRNGVYAREVTPLRAWQVFQDTYAQQKERSLRLRKRHTGHPRDEKLDEVVRSRTMLNTALGLGNGEAVIAAATWIYRTFTTETDPVLVERFADIRRRLEAKELSLYETRGAIERAKHGDFNGDIVSLSEQRQALAVALTQLTGMVKGTEHIGEINSEMSQAELQVYLKGFENARRGLHRFIKNLQKRATTP
jgi:hypothetical protein